MFDQIITVLMAVYNSERFLRQAVESILNQTCKDFEFLIINDASNDKSRDIILSYADDRIKLIDNEENIGLTRSLNKGLKLAQGKYVARMDADDISMPERFEVQLEYMQANPDVGLVGSFYQIIDEDGKDIEELAQDKLPLTHEELVKEHFKTHYVGHGTFFFRKSIINYVGVYDKDFKVTQDMDFILRVSEKFKITNIPAVLYKWRMCPENITSKSNELQIRYKYLAINKALLRKAERVTETVYKQGVLERLLSGYYKIIARRLNEKYHLDELVGKG